jgi:energy-coupling factor transporter ATP-binding protein EcfA2
VRDELRFGPRNLGKSARETEQLVDAALAALGLTDAASTHPYDLPPARRRLVAIAAVLAMDTNLLVLDEPTAGLDNASIALLSNLIQDLVHHGKSAIVVSHDLDFCFETLDRIVLIRDGMLLLDQPAILLDTPAQDLLADAVGLPLGLQVARQLQLSPADPLRAAIMPAA